MDTQPKDFHASLRDSHMRDLPPTHSDSRRHSMPHSRSNNHGEEYHHPAMSSHGRRSSQPGIDAHGYDLSRQEVQAQDYSLVRSSHQELDYSRPSGISSAFMREMHNKDIPPSSRYDAHSRDMLCSRIDSHARDYSVRDGHSQDSAHVARDSSSHLLDASYPHDLSMATKNSRSNVSAILPQSMRIDNLSQSSRTDSSHSYKDIPSSSLHPSQPYHMPYPHSQFRWPGVEVLMDSYQRYVEEQKLEKQILEAQCRRSQSTNQDLNRTAEKLSLRMSDAIQMKHQLDVDRNHIQGSIDNLKKCLKHLPR